MKFSKIRVNALFIENFSMGEFKYYEYFLGENLSNCIQKFANHFTFCFHN